MMKKRLLLGLLLASSVMLVEAKKGGVSKPVEKHHPWTFTNSDAEGEIAKLQKGIEDAASLKELEKFLKDKDLGLTFDKEYKTLSYDEKSDTWFAANYAYFSGTSAHKAKGKKEVLAKIVTKLDGLKDSCVSKAQELLKSKETKKKKETQNKTVVKAQKVGF